MTGKESGVICRPQADQVRYRQSYQPVRFVLIPSGFDFATCLQRPLREAEPSLRPKWKRVYVAYRRQHILCMASPSDISSTSPLFDLRHDASMSGPPYRLYFPKWVVSRLENGGFSVPPELLEPLLVLNTGARHTLSLSNPSTEEELHIELRTDAPSLPSMSSRSRHRDLGQLWCTATVHDRSVEAVDTQVRRWKPTYYDGALTDNNNTVFAARVGLGSHPVGLRRRAGGQCRSGARWLRRAMGARGRLWTEGGPSRTMEALARFHASGRMS